MKNKKGFIITQILFMIAFMLAVTGGYVCSKYDAVIGLLTLFAGFIVLFIKWKYEDKIEKEET